MSRRDITYLLNFRTMSKCRNSETKSLDVKFQNVGLGSLGEWRGGIIFQT